MKKREKRRISDGKHRFLQAFLIALVIEGAAVLFVLSELR